jgi:outer membrane protein OmpA-like peptidoglycan-associated protein
MKNNKLWLAAACVGLIGACAPVVPKELVDARAAYARASTGIAARAAPAELHVASDALAVAEQAFDREPKSFQTRDLSYIAERKAQLAEAAATIALEKKRQARAASNYQSAQAGIVDKTKRKLTKAEHKLDQTNTELAASERDRVAAANQASQESAARKAAEQRASDAQAALAHLAAVKNDRRGVVITLSGSVLFASGKSALLPAARAQLGKVTDVLLKNGGRHLRIEGHTDSQGSNSYNQELSQRRSDAVRTFIVGRGYQARLIKSVGRGEGNPVADNATAEGRANNRRVEIIISPQRTSSR